MDRKLTESTIWPDVRGMLIADIGSLKHFVSENMSLHPEYSSFDIYFISDVKKLLSAENQQFPLDKLNSR